MVGFNHEKIVADIVEYVKEHKYNGIHFHLHDLYIFSEEDLIGLVKRIQKLLGGAE